LVLHNGNESKTHAHYITPEPTRRQKKPYAHNPRKQRKQAHKKQTNGNKAE
jgi:hypothetical protein